MTDALTTDSFGTCSLVGCDMVCPWDMAAVGLDATIYCSPDHAIDALHALDEPPGRVTLHDPQFVVDREPLAVDAAEQAIADIEVMHDRPFRVTEDEADG